MIKILYFARLRELLDCAEESVPADSIKNVADLLALLVARGGKWQAALANSSTVLIAINQEMVDQDSPVQAGDEVAFFPPVTGG